MVSVFSTFHKNVIKLAEILVFSFKLRGKLRVLRSDSSLDCPTFLLRIFPAAVGGLQDDFTPQMLFLKKERGKPPRLSLFAVSAAGVAVPK